MISFRFICFLLTLLPLAAQRTELNKAEFENFVAEHAPSEGGFQRPVTLEEQERVFDYIRQNWRVLLAEYQFAPLRNNSKPPYRLNLDIIVNAADGLEPLEYMEFLERLLTRFEGLDYPAEYERELLFMGETKDSFINVNYNHPRMRALLERAIRDYASDTAIVSHLRDVRNGEYRDTYLNGNVSTNFRPQTLPGVRLPYPDERLLIKVGSVVLGVPLFILLAYLWMAATRKGSV